jgi:dephospho-CoA kinase
MNEMKVIGLTGGIGSGKSTVAHFLVELGAEVIDLDKVGHDVLSKNGNAYKKTTLNFGETILNKNGEIDRNKLGTIVFGDPMALKRLNNIVHPEIDKIVAKKMKEYRQRGVKAVVLEAAVMQEAAKTKQTDEIWVMLAPEETVLRRLKERSGLSVQDVKARIKSQMTNEERAKKADVVIINDGTLNELKVKVKTEWDKLLKRL